MKVIAETRRAHFDIYVFILTTHNEQHHYSGCSYESVKQRYLSRWVPHSEQQSEQLTNSHLKSQNTRKNTTYGDENPCTSLGQAHKYGGIKPINRLPTLLHVLTT